MKALEPILPRRYLTIPQFCATYGIGRAKVYAWIREGKLSTAMVYGTMRRFSVDSAEAFFRSFENAPPKPSHLTGRKRGTRS